MSTDGGGVLGGITGAIVGWVASGGNPLGALYGFQVGAAIGGYLRPPTMQGARLGELAIQTSRDGVPRPIVFGISGRFAGNVIASTPAEIVEEEESVGKGGQTASVEHAYRTYAIRICEGPITAVLRVWRNKKLVYDITGNSLDVYQSEENSNNAQWQAQCKFYLGGYSQMPDPVMQAAFGIENVHGYRGTAYMVMEREDLTQLGGAIPQYHFEVERTEGFTATSHPYGSETSDYLEIGLASPNAYLESV